MFSVSTVSLMYYILLNSIDIRFLSAYHHVVPIQMPHQKNSAPVESIAHIESSSDGCANYGGIVSEWCSSTLPPPTARQAAAPHTNRSDSKEA